MVRDLLMSEQACDLSARRARQLIGSRKLSPVELVDSCIQRIEDVNPAVNAFVSFRYDQARSEARVAEDAVMRGDRLGILHGLPLGVKDLEDVAGMITTYGSPQYRDNLVTQDGSAVARLRRAGAIVLGKTNTPTFGAGANTTNPVFGPTRNPFNTALTCGGSSGGSGVAVACGMAPICTGSDAGGSLRIPAAYNGISAHRSTPGLVSDRHRPIGHSTFGVLGPMARSMGDVAMMLSVMAEHDVGDVLSVPMQNAGLHEIDGQDVSSLRVAFSDDLGFAHVDATIRAVFRERVELFRHIFADSIDASPDLLEVRKCKRMLRNAWFLEVQRDRYNNHRDQIGSNVVANYEDALTMRIEDVVWAQVEQTRIVRSMARFFADVDLLICPCVAAPPFPVEQLYLEAVDGVKLETYYEWFSLTWGLTIPGNPVTAIPCGLDSQGTPFGLQICGPARADRLVLAAAHAIEQFFALDARLARPVPVLDHLRKEAA